MRSVRRIAIAALAGGLALGGAVGASPAHAADGSIYVIALEATSGFSDLSITSLSNGLSMREEEFLQILPAGIDGTYIVRIFDEATQELGRPLLKGDGTCLPAAATAQVVCAFSTPPRQASVQFQASNGPANVAIMDQAPLGLVLFGSLGDDYVVGGGGNDTLKGNGGADRLYGGAGDDYLEGGPGDDYLEGESGSDDMRGGPGSNSLDAADNIADSRVDCGGVPLFLDFDEGMDTPTNCGATPTPIPPAPVEPVDPPAPGQGNGTVDGVPTTVDVGSTGGDNKSVTITAPSNNIFMNTGLWLGTPNTPSVPTFPPLSNYWSLTMPNLYPNSLLDLSIWSGPLIGPTSRVSAPEMAPRAQPISTTGIRVNAQGVAEGDIPVPAGQQPGDFVVQVNAVTASGAAVTINVGVVLTETTPDPNPGPDETIAIASATRGKGKKAPNITVTGTTTGLAGTSITPRYRIQGAKSWKMGKPVAVSDAGTFSWRLTTSKKVRVVMVSGAIKSQPVQVAAVRR